MAYSFQYTKENTDAVVDLIMTAPRMINNILREAQYCFDDIPEIELLRNNFNVAASKYFGNDKATFDDVVDVFVCCKAYSKLAVRTGEAILRREAQKAFSDQIYSLLFCHKSKDTDVYSLNYLWVAEPKEMAKSIGIENIVGKLEEVFGVDSFIANETKNVLTNRKKLMEDIFRQHRKLILENIKEHCKLTGIDISSLDADSTKKAIYAKKSIQSKLSWLKWYHNFCVESNGFKKLKIECTCHKDEITGVGIKIRKTRSGIDKK